MDNKQSQLGSHLISENSTALNTHTNLEEARAAAVRDGIPNTVEAGKSMVKICVTGATVAADATQNTADAQISRPSAFDRVQTSMRSGGGPLPARDAKRDTSTRVNNDDAGKITSDPKEQTRPPKGRLGNPYTTNPIPQQDDFDFARRLAEFPSDESYIDDAVNEADELVFQENSSVGDDGKLEEVEEKESNGLNRDNITRGKHERPDNTGHRDGGFPSNRDECSHRSAVGAPTIKASRRVQQSGTQPADIREAREGLEKPQVEHPRRTTTRQRTRPPKQENQAMKPAEAKNYIERANHRDTDRATTQGTTNNRHIHDVRMGNGDATKRAFSQEPMRDKRGKDDEGKATHFSRDRDTKVGTHAARNGRNNGHGPEFLHPKMDQIPHGAQDLPHRDAQGRHPEDGELVDVPKDPHEKGRTGGKRAHQTQQETDKDGRAQIPHHQPRQSTGDERVNEDGVEPPMAGHDWEDLAQRGREEWGIPLIRQGRKMRGIPTTGDFILDRKGRWRSAMSTDIDDEHDPGQDAFVKPPTSLTSTHAGMQPRVHEGIAARVKVHDQAAQWRKESGEEELAATQSRADPLREGFAPLRAGDIDDRHRGRRGQLRRHTRASGSQPARHRALPPHRNRQNNRYDLDNEYDAKEKAFLDRELDEMLEVDHDDDYSVASSKSDKTDITSAEIGTFARQPRASRRPPKQTRGRATHNNRTRTAATPPAATYREPSRPSPIYSATQLAEWARQLDQEEGRLARRRGLLERRRRMAAADNDVQQVQIIDNKLEAHQHLEDEMIEHWERYSRMSRAREAIRGRRRRNERPFIGGTTRPTPTDGTSDTRSEAAMATAMQTAAEAMATAMSPLATAMSSLVVNRGDSYKTPDLTMKEAEFPSAGGGYTLTLIPQGPGTDGVSILTNNLTDHRDKIHGHRERGRVRTIIHSHSGKQLREVSRYSDKNKLGEACKRSTLQDAEVDRTFPFNKQRRCRESRNKTAQSGWNCDDQHNALADLATAIFAILRSEQINEVLAINVAQDFLKLILPPNRWTQFQRHQKSLQAASNEAPATFYTRPTITNCDFAYAIELKGMNFRTWLAVVVVTCFPDVVHTDRVNIDRLTCLSREQVMRYSMKDQETQRAVTTFKRLHTYYAIAGAGHTTDKMAREFHGSRSVTRVKALQLAR